MVATQPTVSNVFDLACMLPMDAQIELIHKVQFNIRQHEVPSPITKEELLARLEYADAQINQGYYVEHEEAMKHIQSRIEQKMARL